MSTESGRTTSKGGYRVRESQPYADFDELLAILHLERLDDDTFIGAHPSKNPVRTFGGQMMAQAFVAAGRTLESPLPPSALSAHFIAGGDPGLDLEFHVVRHAAIERLPNLRRLLGIERPGTSDSGVRD